MTVGNSYGFSPANLAYIERMKAAQNNNVTKLSASSFAKPNYSGGIIIPCADGVDDGKIGFGGALKNVLKGGFKGAVDMVKGAFTDQNGKFSIGKTLLSVGVTAACIAFPAVGLAACGVGAILGGAKVVSGINNAVNAKTDAEAEQAWQNIGSGTLQTALSVAGAKASFNAVKSTSSAGALESLGKDATIGEKASALLKDSVSSTKNNYATLKETVNLTKSGYKNYKTGTEESATEFLAEKNAASDKAKVQYNILKNYAKNTKAKLNEATEAVKHPIKTYEAYQAAKAEAAQTAETTATVAAQKPKVSFESIKNSLSENGKKICDELTNGNKSYNQLVQQYGWQNVAEVANAIAVYNTSSTSI